MQKITRFVGACIVIVLLAFGCAGLYEKNTGKTAAPRDGSVKGAADETYHLDDTSLSNDIQAILSDNTDLDMSVSVTDLQTGKSYHWGETASYMAASIGKLVTATAFLHKVELGKASLDDMVGGLEAKSQLSKLIIESDNPAWTALNDEVTHEGLQTYARAHGMSSYTADNNSMTSDDTALLLTKLASQKLLDREHTNFLLSLMKQASMRSYIVAAIPDGTDVYHKVGYLQDRLHDAAIIKRGDRSYVLVIFSKASGNYSFSRGATLFGSLTEATLKAFFP